jgi:hypothetical protein
MNEVIKIEDGIIGVITSNTGNLFIFDSCFYDKVQGRPWAENNKRYINSREEWGHHIPFEIIPEGYVVDHIDLDRSNCRESNLRIVTATANQFNADRKTNTSGYTGVHKIYNSWVVDIRVDGKKKYILSSLIKEEAGLAYLLAKIELGYLDFLTAKQRADLEYLKIVIPVYRQESLLDQVRRKV